MSIPLLNTKLYIPPVRSEMVPRPRLIEQLNAGLQRKLTLISAPAGFGKTTLLSEWVAGSEQPEPEVRFAWLSLDESDNDPTRFQSYSIAALQTIETNIAKGVLSALRSPQPPPAEDVLTVLINEITAISGRIILVLDDYHLIKAQPIHNALIFLLDHLPLQMHLVIATRADPPLPLSRLRGRGQLTELRTADLRFTPDEAAAFLNQVMSLGLAAEDVAALEARTEGWIVGLQMAALAMRGRDTEHIARFVSAFAGSHRYILDYLTDEVLLQQPESVQTFLLQTAILDRLTSSLCNAVTGQSDGQTMLERLEAANLFTVPLDDERRWYRYHHLFANLLRRRLSKTQPDLLAALHLQASDWYEKNELIAGAVSHALAAEDIERAVRLVEGRALAMVFLGELTTLVGLLDALPSEVVSSRPWLCIAHAWALGFAGVLDAVESRLKSAETTLDTFGDARRAGGSVLSMAKGRSIAGHIAAIRAYVAGMKGDMSCAAELAREALEQLPEEDLWVRGLSAGLLGTALRWSGDLEAAAQALARAIAITPASESHTAAEALYSLAAVQLAQGQLHKTVASCRDVLLLADEYLERGGRQSPIAASGCWLMSQVLREWNDLDGALRHARESIELCEQWGWPEGLARGYRRLARALQAVGDADGAHKAIQKARQAASGLSPWEDAHMAAHQARLWLAQGNLPPASYWVQESGLSADDELNYQYTCEYSVLTRVLIAQGRLDEASRLLARLLEITEAAGAMSYVIETLVLQALTLQAQGKDAEALTALERALSLAEPEGFVRIFVDEGAPVAALLRQAVVRGIAVEYVGRLLAAFDEGAAEASSGSHTQQLIEPLSKRELEVLRLLTTRLSSTEMAEELYISVNTVRYHIKNIYSKLNVHRRADAVGRAKELKLL